MTCFSCGGTGFRPCITCGSTAPCPACSSRGSIRDLLGFSAPGRRARPDPAWATTRRTGPVNCFTCNDTGRKTCITCGSTTACPACSRISARDPLDLP